jgi:hypothetical protein
MRRRQNYAICIKNRGYPASLEVRKVYRLLADPEAERRKQVRVIDESGEDYLFPATYFVPIDLPRDVGRIFRRRSA